MHPQLDHITPIRSRITRVRWIARPGDSDIPVAHVHAKADIVRLIELTMPKDQIILAARFCEDFAFHDWLLTTIAQVIEQAERAETAGHEAIDILRPAAKRLLHLWMPGTYVDPTMGMLWDALERRSGFSLQWNTQATRIRDWIYLQTLQALERVRHNVIGSY